MPITTKALYYPHIQITNKDLIKTSLLLWDSIQYISPNGTIFKNPPFIEKSYNEAYEIIVKPLVPTEEEKASAGKEIEQFLNTFPQTFFNESVLGYNDNQSWRKDYLIYPEKFLRSTWTDLKYRGYSQWIDNQARRNVPPALGLLMMSILANNCAGTQIHKVTDRLKAYAWLNEHTAKFMGSQYLLDVDASQFGEGTECIVTIALDVLDGRNIPITKLLEFRKREVKESSTDYRKLRLNYASRLQECIKRIHNEARTKRDIQEIQNQFKQSINENLQTLKKELKINALDVLFSKQVLFTVVIAAGSILAPIVGITNVALTLSGIGVIPLITTLRDFRKKREELLRNNSMSWLYLTKQGKIPLY